MASKALGTVLKINSNTVAGVKSIGGIELSADVLDVTTLSDTARRKIQGLIDAGEIPVSGFFDPTDTNGQTAVKSAFDSGAVTPFSIVFPNGASWNFNAIISKFKLGDANIDGTIDFEHSLAIDGLPTLNLTASTGLTGLTVSDGTLTPTFATGKYEYNLTTTQATITVTPTAAASTITVNGVAVTSGSASGSIAITSGGITAIMIAVSQSSKTPLVYKINVYRA